MSGTSNRAVILGRDCGRTSPAAISVTGKMRVDAEVPSQTFFKPAQSKIRQMPEIPNFYVAILKVIGDSIRKDVVSGNGINRESAK